MKIFSYLSSAIKIENSTFILGGFEAIHKGHIELIKKAKNFNDGPVVVCIFRDPQLLPKNKDGNLLQLDIRLMFLAQLKVDYVIIIDFNEWLRYLSAEKFINLLIDNGAKRFVIGKDYRFGMASQWGGKELKSYFPTTEIVDLIKDKNVKISASLIKEGVIFGDLDYINSQLAFNYTISFDFVGEEKPLLWPQNTTRLAKGIYFANFVYSNREYHGLIHINFDGQSFFKILDSDLEFIISSNIVVEFLHKYRPIISKERDKIERLDLDDCLNFFDKKLNNSQDKEKSLA